MQGWEDFNAPLFQPLTLGLTDSATGVVLLMCGSQECYFHSIVSEHCRYKLYTALGYSLSSWTWHANTVNSRFLVGDLVFMVRIYAA